MVHIGTCQGLFSIIHKLHQFSNIIYIVFSADQNAQFWIKIKKKGIDERYDILIPDSLYEKTTHVNLDHTNISDYTSINGSILTDYVFMIG